MVKLVYFRFRKVRVMLVMRRRKEWLTCLRRRRCRDPVERRRMLEQMEEREMFMELIRDVANELDIDVLCHKILINVGLLTKADRGSLFLARGRHDHRYLVAKLFDVTVDTGTRTHIRPRANPFHFIRTKTPIQNTLGLLDVSSPHKVVKGRAKRTDLYFAS